MPYSVRPLRRRYLSNTPSVSPESAPPSRAAVGLRHGPGRLRRRDGPPLAVGQAAVRRAPRLHTQRARAGLRRARRGSGRPHPGAPAGQHVEPRRARGGPPLRRPRSAAPRPPSTPLPQRRYAPTQDARCLVTHAVTSTPPGQRPPPTRSAPSAHTPRAHPPRPAASAQLPSSETANHLVEAMIISASSSTWPKSGPTPAPITVH
jgi:hypothetical protein